MPQAKARPGLTPLNSGLAGHAPGWPGSGRAGLSIAVPVTPMGAAFGPDTPFPQQAVLAAPGQTVAGV